MDHRRPTKIGDVLILCSRQSYTVYAVGAVSTAGQEDFSHADNVVYVDNQAEATTVAKAHLGRQGRIYLFDIDTDEWSEIST